MLGLVARCESQGRDGDFGRTIWEANISKLSETFEF